MSPTVTVTETDVEHCRAYVERVQARSNARGYDHANARPRSAQQRVFDDVNGHCAEIAFCRWLGVEWAPDINAFHAIPDALGVFEIRATTYSTGRLIIRDDEDAADRCYVLVTGNAWREPRVMTLRGYLWGREADEQYLDNPNGHRPSLFIPQSALHPFTVDVRARIRARLIEAPAR
jgi:hypothetical protein